MYKGAGVLAGGPYYCTEDTEDLLVACTTKPDEIDLDTIIGDAVQFASEGKIADLKNITGNKVWLWGGGLDTVVVQGVEDFVNLFYTNFEADIKYGNKAVMAGAEHGFPTDLEINTNKCD